MRRRLDGKSALVTGAGNGIGRAVAMMLASEGAQVVVNDLGTDEEGRGADRSAADATVATIDAGGGTAVANHSSVASFDGAGDAVRATVEAFGKIDIYVACAGAAIEGSIFEMPEEQYHATIALQLSQKWFLARHAVPLMAAQGFGRVINTTSHGALGVLGQPAFAAAMGGVVSLTKALATETAGTGITANCLAPGAATRLHAKSHDEFKAWHDQGLIDDAMWDSYVNTPPPEYVAPIVTWLCTDAADGVNGEVFHAAGGELAVWTTYEDRRTLDKGNHREVDPWTLDELDAQVPAALLS